MSVGLCRASKELIYVIHYREYMVVIDNQGAAIPLTNFKTGVSSSWYKAPINLSYSVRVVLSTISGIPSVPSLCANSFFFISFCEGSMASFDRLIVTLCGTLTQAARTCHPCSLRSIRTLATSTSVRRPSWALLCEAVNCVSAQIAMRTTSWVLG